MPKPGSTPENSFAPGSDRMRAVYGAPAGRIAQFVRLALCLTLVTLFLAAPLTVAAASAPVVDRFTATPGSVLPDGTVLLEVEAHDPNCGGTCTTGCGAYIRADLTAWSATAGSFLSTDNGVNGSPYAASAVWQAPSAEGSYSVSVTLADSGTFLCGGRQSLSVTLDVAVSSTPNGAPTITSLTAHPARVFPGQSSSLSCVATDPDGDPLGFAWGVEQQAGDGTWTPAGGLSSAGTGSATLVEASPGTYRVTCSATDTKASAVATVQVACSEAMAEGVLAGTLSTPQRVAVDDEGLVYVADQGEGGVVVLGLGDGRLVRFLRATSVTSVAIDWAGRLVIGARTGAWVSDLDGRILAVLAPGRSLGPVGDVAVDRVNGRYGVLYPGPARVAIYDGAGTLLRIVGERGDGPGQLSRPTGVAFDPTGNVVIADAGHGVIQILDGNGAFVRSIGSPGTGAGSFVRLDAVAVDAQGILYATDAFQSWLQTFNPDGSLREVLGTYGTGPGEFVTPAGIAVSETFDRLLVASLNSSSLHVFRRSPAPPVPPVPSVALSESALTFPERAVGQATPTLPLTLTNAGQAPLGLLGVRVSGEFGQVNDCGAWVAPGDTCRFDVSYVPETAGLSVGSMTLETSGEPRSHEVALAGSAFLPGDLGVDPTFLSFPDQAVGTVSDPAQVLLTNRGTRSVALQGFSATTGFGVAEHCGASLAPAQSCTLDVFFAPGTAGDQVTGSLEITSSAASGPHSVSLEGRGISLALTPTPDALDFGQIRRGESVEPRAVVLRNDGSDFIDVGLVALQGQTQAFEVVADGCSGLRLWSGDTCTLWIRFGWPARPAPKSAWAPPRPVPVPGWPAFGRQEASLDITSRAPDSPDRVDLVGFLGAGLDVPLFRDDFESADLSRWPWVSLQRPPVLRFGGATPAAQAQAVLDPAAGQPRLPVAVVNDGDTPLRLDALMLTGPQAGRFRVESDGCSGRWLAPGATCEAVVAAAGTMAERATAELVVSGDGVEGRVELSTPGTEEEVR